MDILMNELIVINWNKVDIMVLIYLFLIILFLKFSE